MKLFDTLAEERKQIEDRNGNKYPARVLANLDSVHYYNRTKTRLLPHIRSVNEAHVIMLCEQGILKKEDASMILQAIRNLDYEAYRNSAYTGKYEDMYFEQEAEIIEKTNGIGANMHIARSRNDMCIMWSRLSVRDNLLKTTELLIQLQNVVRLFAEEHKDTLYVIHTHTQHAQPGLFGHYFLGFLDVLDRCIKRFRYAYEQTNVSNMGAAAVTTSGYPISRERVSELLGCDGVIENAFDSIGNNDYFMASSSAVSLCALDLGRTVTDLILWATEEMNMIRLTEGYCTTSSIMPQKRNPIALEHLRASLSVAKGLSDTVQTGFLKSPYGDISDYEDIEDTMNDAFDKLNENIEVLHAVIGTMEVSKELLRQRAFESFSVVTEIADEMYRSYGIPFRKAHGFVAFLVRKARQQAYNLKHITELYFAEAYQEYFAEPFQNDFTPVKKCLDPEHFVRIRENLGGTGKKAMENQLISAKEKIRKNTKWLEHRRLQIEEAENKRNSIVWM